LDVGCGTGATAVRLARLGVHVTVLDSSPAMLNIAKRAAQEAGVTDKVVLQHGDATRLANLFHTASFDVILCHNVLESLDDPRAVLCGAARALRDSSAILSVLVRNRAGEVFKAAIQAADLAVAENNLTAEWGQESLYGGRVRLFTSDSLQAMLKAASLEVMAERGVRLLAGYLPPRVSRSAEYDRNTWSACWACPGIVKKKNAAAQTTAARPDGTLGENNCRFLPTPRFLRKLPPQGSYLLAPTLDAKEPLLLYGPKFHLTKSTSGDCCSKGGHQLHVPSQPSR